MKTAEKIGQVRALMEEKGLDGFVVPNTDPHQSEYVAEYWKCRRWVSGFSGSAGTVAFLKDRAGLWTDGRYFIQAEKELQGSGIDLFKMRMNDVPEMIDWLCEHIPENGKLGIDGRQLTSESAQEWKTKLEKKKIQLVTELDLISPLWADRPPIPNVPVICHDLEYTGRSTKQNLAEIRDEMRKKEADTYLISSLYDIAWLCNIRGGDIPHCPLVMSYVLLTLDRAQLFVDLSKLSDEVRCGLAETGISVHPYEKIAEALNALPGDRRVYLDERRVNIFLRQQIPHTCTLMNGKDLTELPKAKKNATQFAQWDKVQKWDGAAMVRFWKWLETAVSEYNVTECTASDRLEAFRRAHSECVGLSFSSISGYGSNAAMMHYFPQPETCAVLKSEGLYLIDSGGQYLGGTTDITRTFALGDLTDEQQTDYTLVLKGVINLSTAIFLEGTAGANLDILARQPLWANGIDYKCGTGHGVGFFLNVHEGPQNFSQSVKSDTKLEPGMILTIEPGVYKENRHGIRIENMVSVVDAMKTESGTFYRFNTLTYCPIDTAPLKMALLNEKEIDWLNTYHATVYENLAPHLTAEEKDWLKIKTAPLATGHKVGSNM